MLSYLIQGTDQIDPVALRMAISESFQDSGEDLMPTIAEQWKSEGREEGIKIGWEQGLEIGRREAFETGVLIGQINACQEILGITVTKSGELFDQGTESLKSLLDQLRSRLPELNRHR